MLFLPREKNQNVINEFSAYHEIPGTESWKESNQKDLRMAVFEIGILQPWN